MLIKKEKLLYMSRAPIPTTKQNEIYKIVETNLYLLIPREMLFPNFQSLSKKTEIEKKLRRYRNSKVLRNRTSSRHDKTKGKIIFN